MSRFSRVLHHIDMNDVKRRHQEKIVASKLEEERIQKEKEYIASVVEKEKSDWKKELEESQWTPVQSSRPTNSASQTFQHDSGGTATFSGLGGSDAIPSQVTLDLGFGETVNVATPTYNQIPLAGLPMPVAAADPMARRNNAKKARETNAQLEASEKATKMASGAAEIMKARVTLTGDENPAYIKDLSERAKLVKERVKAVKKWKDQEEKITKQHQPALNKWYASREADAKSRANSVVSKAHELGWKGPIKFDVLRSSAYQVTENNTLLVIERQSSWGEWDDIHEKDEMNIRVIKPWINPKTGKEEKISLYKHNKPVNATQIIDSKYSKGVSSGTFQADCTVTGIDPSNYEDNSIRGLKDIPQPVRPQGKLKMPKSYEKNMMMGEWSPVSKEMEDYLNKLKIPFSTSLSGVKFAGQLALRLASGDLRPITKSPGFAYNNIAKDIVSRAVTNALAKNITSAGKGDLYPSYYNPKTGVGQVMNDAYDSLPGNNSVIDAVVRASIGKFTFRSKPDGLEIHDVFDLTRITSVGGADFASIITKPMGFGSVQTIANKLTAIAMQRGAEAGFDMKDSEGKDIWSLSADDVDEKTSGTDLATPKGFDINVTFTIPWGQLPPELRSQLGGKEVNNRGRTVKPHRLDAYGGVDKLFDKKKKVNESTFETVKQLRKMWEYDGKPSPDGFPDNPPPKLKNGWHPEYGNKDAAYNRLDPESAKAMPETGNPKIDKKVKKAKKQPK